MFTIGLLIGSDQLHHTDAVFDRHSPIDGQVATRAAAASVEDAIRAADSADRAFAEWSRTGPNHRRKLLLAAADEIAAREAEFVSSMRAEIGATDGWAKFNVSLAASMLREAAALTTHVTGETIPSDRPGCLAMSIRRPAGVCLGIAPWNAPVILGVRAVATALACGNSAILKGSELCPRTHVLIGEALIAAGIPAGVINVITNAPEDADEVVGALIEHPAVKRISFTGSSKVGRLIAEKAGRHLKPVLLELGGKSPILVLKDADLSEAVKAASFGAFLNQGQICMSTERIIVDKSVADEFLQRLGAKARTLTSGDPKYGAHPLGSMATALGGSKVRELVQDAVDKGARVICGGGGDAAFMDATIVDGVTSNMRIYAEESFGPVVGVLRAEDTEHAIALANDSDYGLSASVFSSNIAVALSVASRIDAGMCHINGATVHDEAQMPFGGVKASGYGRFGGKAGISEFTDLRWMTIETQPGQFPI